jgi:hypothetical protein
MNILFISYAEVSLRGGHVRSMAILRALADAGHRVDLIAPHTDPLDHPNIRILNRQRRKPCRAKLRWASLRAVGREPYDAIHATDSAVFFACRLSRWKKIPLVYDAVRRFTGSAAVGNSKFLKLFPTHFQRLEASVLDKAGCIFSPCSALTTDLLSMDRLAPVIQLEDIPIQPLYARKEVDKSFLWQKLERRPASVIVCSTLPGNAVGFRNLLMSARKVIEAVPDIVFFFKGVVNSQVQKMAANLDITEHCVFLSNEEPEIFLSALDVADAVLLVPQGNSRYPHSQVYTLLHAAAPLVTIHNAAYDEILTDKTSIRVLPDSESIAEGVLRAIQEPLFSLAVAIEGQQLVADRYTYSSFKHKVRMAYHKLSTQK